MLLCSILYGDPRYLGGGFFRGDGSRGFTKDDPNYEEYDTKGITIKVGRDVREISLSLIDTQTAEGKNVMMFGADMSVILMLDETHKSLFNPFLSIGVGIYGIDGSTLADGSEDNAKEATTVNGSLGFFVRLSKHFELEARMNGKFFLWDTSTNKTGENAVREADSMTNYYVGLNWYFKTK